jgi:hypothetical protein
LEYCEYHKDDPLETNTDAPERNKRTAENISEWDQKYLQVDQEMLFEIILVSAKQPLGFFGCYKIKQNANLICIVLCVDCKLLGHQVTA